MRALPQLWLVITRVTLTDVPGGITFNQLRREIPGCNAIAPMEWPERVYAGNAKLNWKGESTRAWGHMPLMIHR